MRYAEFSPAPILTEWIRCYWSLTAPGNELGERQPERVIPDGCMEMIFHYGDRFIRWRDEIEHEELQERVLVTGQIERSIELIPTGSIGIFAIRFQPGAAFPFLGIPCSELTGETIGLGEISTGWEPFVDAILAGSGDAERVAIADRTLAARLARSELRGHREVTFAVNALASAGGLLNANEIAALVGLSARQVQRQFNQWVGLTPKRLAKIVRLRSAVLKLGESRSHDWARLAVDCGYYDQAHFNHEFKVIVGESPGAFAKNQHEMAKKLISKS